MRETDGAIRLQIELPGLERENVSITVENNQLVVSGSRPDWSVDGTVLVRERRVGDYYRAFTLDNTVDADAIEATMRNGVLDLTIPLTESAKPRRIEITGS